MASEFVTLTQSQERYKYAQIVLSKHSFFHIIAITETKLDPNLDASSIVHLHDYFLLPHDRNKDGGGVAFFSIILSQTLFFAYLMISGLVSTTNESICSVK